MATMAARNSVLESANSAAGQSAPNHMPARSNSQAATSATSGVP
jgi:hypothetical protein